MNTLAFAAAVLALAAAPSPQEPQKKKSDAKECPLHEQHTKEKKAAADHEHHEMNRRGEDARGMGFTQGGTVHHFLLARTGGAIQVEVSDTADHATLNAVRKHLQHIAESFTRGDFSIPQFVHGKEPDGVRALQQMKAKIQYVYEPMAAGGRVVIRASDKKAIAAVQDFLRFQIVEHRTGDSLVPPQ